MSMINTKARNKPQRLYLILASSTALLTVGLIVFGAVVRVTDSGLGCGSDWPLCDGRLLPPLDNITAWIEWLHRLFAALIGLLGLGTLGVAIRAYRHEDKIVLNFTIVAAVLFFLQSMLGAIVVVFELPPTFVTLHLGTAMLLLGALLMAAVAAWYQPQQQRVRDYVTTLTYANTVFTLVIILTGALVRGSGATLACTDWPLCNGSVLPASQGTLAMVHMVHRYAVAALGITLLLLVWQVWQSRVGMFVRGVAIAAFVVYLMQAAVGALFVLSVAGPQWGAAHVGLASTTWGLLVILSAIETLNNRELATVQTETAWNPQ